MFSFFTTREMTLARLLLPPTRLSSGSFYPTSLVGSRDQTNHDTVINIHVSPGVSLKHVHHNRSLLSSFALGPPSPPTSISRAILPMEGVSSQHVQWQMGQVGNVPEPISAKPRVPSLQCVCDTMPVAHPFHINMQAYIAASRHFSNHIVHSFAVESSITTSRPVT